MTSATKGKLLDLKSLLPSISEQEVSDYRDEHPDETENCLDEGVQGAIILQRMFGADIAGKELPIQMPQSLAGEVATALDCTVRFTTPEGNPGMEDPIPADSQEPATPEDEKADY